MKKYEMIREIFNSCDNSKMRDVKISEVETDDPETFVRELTPGGGVKLDKQALGKATFVFDVDADGLMQRITFTEIP